MAGLATAKCVPCNGGTQPYPGCGTGAGKRYYQQGERIAETAFRTSWNFLKKDCGQLDMYVLYAAAETV